MPDIATPMGAFIAGLVLAAASMMTAYIMQLRLLDEARHVLAGASHRNVHPWLLYLTMAMLSGSLCAFSYGAWSGAEHLTSVGSTCVPSIKAARAGK
jgi:hypothetical protein